MNLRHWATINRLMFVWHSISSKMLVLSFNNSWFKISVDLFYLEKTTNFLVQDLFVGL